MQSDPPPGHVTARGWFPVRYRRILRRVPPEQVGTTFQLSPVQRDFGRHFLDPSSWEHDDATAP